MQRDSNVLDFWSRLIDFSQFIVYYKSVEEFPWSDEDGFCIYIKKSSAQIYIWCSVILIVLDFIVFSFLLPEVI